jgi:glycolate oxidase
MLDLPDPSALAREQAQRALEAALGPSKVLVRAESCEAYAADESDHVGRVPDAVVLAESHADVCCALRVAQETGVPVTPRGAGTGRVGGAVPLVGGIVICLARMKRIKEIDRREGLAVVEAGVVLRDLHEAVEREGWFYPPDPGSLDTCTLGGNVAANAGGARAFKYGVTGDYVLGLQAMLVGGERLQVGRRTRKGVTGYDLTSLLVGSEGTLAVLGDVTLRLVPRPERVTTLLGLFGDVHQASRAVEEIIAAAVVPRCLELLDAATLQALRDASNPIDGRAGALLLIEVDGDEAACDAQALRIGGACEAAGALEVLVAQDAAQRDRLWRARREMSDAVRRLAKFKLSEDVVVPRQRVATLIERALATADRLRVRTLAYGHAGDGNLHMNFLWDDPEERPRVDQAIVQLFRDTVELGGTLSGEHGIGVLKAPFLPLEQAAGLIDLERRIKALFDPAGLLNPGKIFEAAERRCC